MHWISHRGVKITAPENSLTAFKAARDAGFTTLETDLRLTSDGHIVLTHDRSIKRLTSRDENIDNLTRRDIESIKIPPTGEGFLFLDQFIREFTGLNWIFDIKAETAVGVIDALHALATSFSGHDMIMAQTHFLTWDAAHEAYLKKDFPKAICYARASECWRAGLCLLVGLPWLGGIKAGRTYSLPPKLRSIDLYKPWIVRVFHRRQAKVLAFLPKTALEVEAAASAGFDEILSDLPPDGYQRK